MTAPTMRLVTDPAAAVAALEDACAWCTRFAFSTPAADSNLDAWPLWRTIVQHGSKLDAAIVGVEGMRSEPHALAWLQGQEALRFVPAADGSFRANIYRFERDGFVRVLMGSGALVRPGLMAPFDALLFWEGPALSPFAAEVDRMLHKARALAHVPTQEELDTYSRAFFAGATLREELAVLGAPFIRSTARDAEIPVLELVVDRREVQRAMRGVRQRLIAAATQKRRQAVGFQGGNMTATIHWSAPLKLWSLFEGRENRYWNCFGTARPDREKALSIVVEVNPPLEGINRQMGGAFARDPASGEVYFVHRGRIGGGQKGIGAELFWNRFRGGVGLREPGREELARVVVVGKVGGAELPRDVAAFVHEVGRIKAGGA